MRRFGVVLALLLIPALVMGTLACAGGGTQPATLHTPSLWTGDALVQTVYGPVQGFSDQSNTWVWKAIPYAKPPVGELRWKAPQDPDPWNTTRAETQFCSECTQYTLTGLVTGSEDCLYLNIWRPQSEQTNLPVYFWIHGGGNSEGTASYEGYNGSNIAGKSDMVVVTVNYRLGPLGWFTYPALRSGQPGHELDDSGNYGTLDLIKALQWVQANIQAFGGNTSNVTIAGESAGAINVFSLLISPLAHNLFQKAIAQSGLPIARTVADGEASAHDVILKLLVNDGTAADADSAQKYLDTLSDAQIEAYLRSKSAAELLKAYDTGYFGMIAFPYIFEDGTVIPKTGYDTFVTGTYPNKVPLIIGTNKEETKIFLFLDPTFIGKDELYQDVASFSSDLWKAVGADGVARELSSHPDQPNVYVYQFLWGSGGDTGTSVIPAPWGFKLGACHSLDIPFFFGNDIWNSPLDKLVFTKDNQAGREALSSAMMSYVAQFARTGDPNKPGASLTEWSPWSNAANGPKCILFNVQGDLPDLNMSNVELTESGVKARLASEVPEPQYSEIIQYLRKMSLMFELELTLP
jgi:para-nitrobenzyl esterase